MSEQMIESIHEDEGDNYGPTLSILKNSRRLEKELTKLIKGDAKDFDDPISTHCMYEMASIAPNLATSLLFRSYELWHLNFR